MITKRHPHPNCLLCGDSNPWSLRLSFHLGADGEVAARFRGRAELQGYDGILHGGVVASLLDSAMTNCLFHHGIRAVTGELKVRYRRPTPYEVELEIRASVTECRPPLYVVESELLCAGEVMASASAKFMQAPQEMLS